MKLWKVTVNGIGWSKPDTSYFDKKHRAEAYFSYMMQTGHGCDGVQYAGNFTDQHAKELLDANIDELREAFRND